MYEQAFTPALRLVAAAALAALAACSDRNADTAAAAPPPAAARAPVSAAKPPPPAPAPVAAADHTGDKVQSYIKCYNDVNSRAQDSITRYASWVKDMKTGPTGKERIVYGLYTLSESGVVNCDKNINAALELKPALAGLDDSARAYRSALLQLNDRINEADRYYNRKNYEDDGFAKGKEMHAPLAKAMQDFRAASSTFSDALEVENDKLQVKELAEVEKAEGRKLRYWRMDAMADAKHIVRLMSEDTFDVTQATAKVDAFEKATDALVDYAKAHKDEQPMMWSSMESALESYRVAAKERLRRVRDKTPYSQGDRMMLNANSGWMISGSPDKLVRNYNELITTSNRLN